jgi:hypothetical protein
LDAQPHDTCHKNGNKKSPRERSSDGRAKRALLARERRARQCEAHVPIGNIAARFRFATRAELPGVQPQISAFAARCELGTVLGGRLAVTT